MIERCNDGEMQNILKWYGENPGPIRETTRLMYEKRLAKHLDQRTTPTSGSLSLYLSLSLCGESGKGNLSIFVSIHGFDFFFHLVTR